MTLHSLFMGDTSVAGETFVKKDKKFRKHYFFSYSYTKSLTLSKLQRYFS